jgi:hypothetical protein
MGRILCGGRESRRFRQFTGPLKAAKWNKTGGGGVIK